MEFQKLIETRRTIRKYAADSEVTREQMEALIRAAQEAPSWKNSETGRYYCVLSREMVDRRMALPTMNLEMDGDVMTSVFRTKT